MRYGIWLNPSRGLSGGFFKRPDGTPHRFDSAGDAYLVMERLGRTPPREGMLGTAFVTELPPPTVPTHASYRV